MPNRSFNPLGSEMDRLPLRFNFLANASGGEDSVDAWLYMAHSGQTLENNMYTPVLLTVRAALKSIGANVRVVDTVGAKDTAVQIRNKVKQKGKATLVVAVAHFFGGVEAMQILQECKSAGAYLALYQTEPKAEFLDLMLSDVARVGAHEVWTYNMESFKSSQEGVSLIVRHFPPGYMEEMAREVSMNSPEGSEHVIGFLGELGSRSPDVMQVYAEQLQINGTYDVWTPEDCVHWVERHPLQLNVHKIQTVGPGTSRLGAETFRFSMLLTFKACISSAKSDSDDEEDFEGIVRFVEAEETGRVFETLTKKPNGVKDCQTKSFELFKERFEPKHLLERSGLMQAWQP
eukprot:TRINITY_DN26405_c0_g1_i1.p1 TRINITY_DN26405_c0_g1~~TRINITY_DN26405_c0_g1_i1.p1  ORF type:complete len:407 (+),score=48.35 TRINITY_DN26405_c0_g1_i1:184-1221(+)